MIGKVARVVIGLAIAVVVVLVIGPRRIAHSLRLLEPTTAILALLFLTTEQLMTLLRWQYLIGPTSNASRRHNARVYLYSNFLNSFGPGNLAGDGYRIVALRRAPAGTPAVVTAVIRERVFGVCSYLLAYVLAALVMLVQNNGALYRGAFRWMTIAVLCVIVSAAPLVTILRRLLIHFGNRVSGWLREGLSTVKRGFELGSVHGIAICLALSMAAWLCWVGAVVTLSRGLGVPLPWSVLAAIATVTEIVRFVPITFQGIGVREGTFALLVGMAGGNQAHGFTLGAVVYLLLTLILVMSAPASWVLALLE